MDAMTVSEGGATAVSTVLTAVTTYATSWVSDMTSWIGTFAPVALPIAGTVLAVTFAVRIFKRLARG